MTSKPNILVFLTDDHGQWASSCYGNRKIHSPTLEYLAASGAKMNHAFTPCPVCSPARACFFTGKFPSGHGIHDHIAEESVGQDHPGVASQTTIAQRLQENGYYTGLVGKWHLNHFRTKPSGFDEWFTQANGTNAQFRAQDYFENDRKLSHFGNQAIHLTDRALQFLRSRDGSKPFFLFVGYTNTHRPHMGEPERLVRHYRQCTFSDIPVEEHQAFRGAVRRTIPIDLAERREDLAQYYAAVNLIDEQVGRIIDELANRGELDHTLVVYTADHGHMNGHHGLHGKGNATTPQNFLDESIHVPCLLSWPGHIRAGQIRSEFVDHCDLTATLLDASQYDHALCRDPDLEHCPGRSYLPLLDGRQMSWRTEQICEYGNARMIRTEQAKLIRRYPGPNGHFDDEFYDLGADPRENQNRIADPIFDETIHALDQRLKAFFHRFEVPEYSGKRIADLPTCNASEPWGVTPEHLERNVRNGRNTP